MFRLFYLHAGILLRLVRWGNLIILALAQLLVAAFLSGPLSDIFARLGRWQLWVLLLACMLTAAAGYVINDYYDVKIDIINRPRRVIIDRRLSRRKALLYHVLLSLIGIGLGFWVGLWIGLACLTTTFLLWLYSNRLKRTLLVGNLLIAFLSAFSLILPAFLFLVAYWPVVWLFAVYAFLVSLLREIVKDIEDLRGDARFGCQTLPIVLGLRATKYITAFICLALMYGIFFPPLQVSFLFRIYTILIAFFLVFFLYRLYSADRRRHFRHLSRIAKIIMLLGIIAIVFFSHFDVGEE